MRVGSPWDGTGSSRRGVLALLATAAASAFAGCTPVECPTRVRLDPGTTVEQVDGDWVIDGDLLVEFHDGSDLASVEEIEVAAHDSSTEQVGSTGVGDVAVADADEEFGGASGCSGRRSVEPVQLVCTGYPYTVLVRSDQSRTTCSAGDSAGQEVVAAEYVLARDPGYAGTIDDGWTGHLGVCPAARTPRSTEPDDSGNETATGTAVAAGRGDD